MWGRKSKALENKYKNGIQNWNKQINKIGLPDYKKVFVFFFNKNLKSLESSWDKGNAQFFSGNFPFV